MPDERGRLTAVELAQKHAAMDAHESGYQVPGWRKPGSDPMMDGLDVTIDADREEMFPTAESANLHNLSMLEDGYRQAVEEQGPSRAEIRAAIRQAEDDARDNEINEHNRAQNIRGRGIEKQLQELKRDEQKLRDRDAFERHYHLGKYSTGRR